MTVTELEGRIGMRELVHWVEFEKEFGPLTLHERLDAAVARLSAAVMVAGGADPTKVDPADYMPAWKDEPIISANEFLHATSRKA